jgi:hypothetical protein
MDADLRRLSSKLFRAIDVRMTPARRFAYNCVTKCEGVGTSKNAIDEKVLTAVRAAAQIRET